MQPEKAYSQTPQQNALLLGGRSTELDLNREMEELRHTPEWEHGIARKVLIRYPDLQITLRRMKANTRIPDHYNPGRICIQTVFGHIRMRTEDKLFDLPQGRMLVLDRAITHDVEAIEESAFLLTVAYPENGVR